MEAPLTLFAVQDTYGGTTLMLVNAVDGLSALDAYCVKNGVAPYSALDLDELTEYVYEYPKHYRNRRGHCACETPIMDVEHDAGCRRCGLPVDFSGAPEGLVGAVHSNYEIVAVPATTPFRATGKDKNGIAIMDAAGICLTDGWPSEEEAYADVAAAPNAERSRYSQPEFFADNEEGSR